MVTCELCGQTYDNTAAACHSGCPLASLTGCGLLCCPHCGYQAVDERKSKVAQLLRRLWPQMPDTSAPGTREP